MTRSLGLPALALFAACSGSAGGHRPPTTDTLPGGIVRVMNHSPSDSGAWHLVLERTVAPAEGAQGELVNPQDLALADDGTLYVSDTKPRVIKMFDTAGVLVRTIGRDGDGPGEFRTAYLTIHGDTLAVQDPRSKRLSIFDSRTGAAILQRESVCCYFAPIGIDGSGRAVALIMTIRDTSAPVQRFARFSLDGSRFDSVAIPEHRSNNPQWFMKSGGKLIFSMQVPLTPRDIHAVDPLGGFVTGWSGEYLVRSTRNGRDTVALFGRPIRPEPISGAEKQAIIDARVKENLENATEAELRAGFDASLIPDHRPAFMAIALDKSGRRWIRVSSSDTMRVHFDLFDPTGRWLDQVTVPAHEWPREAYEANAWNRDHAAVMGEDAAGRPVVRIFRIEHRGK